MDRAHNAHVGPAGVVVGRSSQAEEHMSLESWPGSGPYVVRTSIHSKWQKHLELKITPIIIIIIVRYLTLRGKVI